MEAGKRLAAISKEAKERKMRQKIESEDSGFSINYALVFGGIGAITSIGALYYARKSNNREERVVEIKDQETKNEKRVEEPEKKNNVLDTL